MFSPRQLRLIAVALMLLAFGSIGIYWWRLSLESDQHRSEAVLLASARAAQLANLQAQHTQALLLGFDLALRQFRDAFEGDETPAEEAVVHATMATLPPGSVVHWLIVDAQGYVVHPRKLAKQRIFLGDRAYFKFHQQDAQTDRLYVSKALLGRLKDRWVLPLSRALLRRGQFNGVAILSLVPEYFASGLDALKINPDDNASLVYEDGTYVAPHQHWQKLIGKPVAADLPFLANKASVQGVYRQLLPGDPVARINAWSRLKAYPLIVNVGLDESRIVQPIEREIAAGQNRSRVGITLMLALDMALCWLLLRLAQRSAELARSRASLQQSHDLLSKLSKHVPGVIFEYRVYPDGRSCFPFISEAVREMYGLTPEQVRDDASAFFAFRHPDDAPGLAASMQQAIRSVRRWQHEYRLILPAQGMRWRYGEADPERQSDGSIAWYGFITDITERKRSEERRRLNASVFETLDEAVMVTDKDAIISAVNPAFCRITGYAESEVLGQPTRLLSSGRHDKAFYQLMWQSLRDSGKWAGEVWNRRKDGDVFPEWQTISSVKNAHGQVEHYVAVFADLSEIRKAQDKAETLAWRDALTGLANRALFLRQLTHALANVRREKRFANILLINLDRFKQINDARGPNYGDKLLKAVAAFLSQILHPDDLLARLNADEFAVLLPRLNADCALAGREVLVVAEKLRDALRADLRLDGEPLALEVSIGIAQFALNEQDSASDVLRQAEMALHQAKEAGGANAVFFETAMGLAVRQRYQLERELQQAIKGAQLRLYLQAQVDERGQLVGAEALVRWQHPQRGLIAPGEFIALAEATDLIVRLDQWMLEQVCELLQRLPMSHQRLRISVNISPRHFQKADFVDQVKHCLTTFAIDPARLVLEVTEGLVMGDVNQAVATMSALTVLGLHFSLDDFGTGYSSLAYLQRLPIHELKIDKSFVDHCHNDVQAAALVETILAIARLMRLQVVAEGVETREQVDFLNAHGQVIHQGYYFGRPTPAEAWLAALSAASLPSV